MSNESVSRYLQLTDLYFKLDLSSDPKAESLGLELDEIWQKLTETERQEVNAKLQITE
jgi:hypothetical protein